MRPTYTNRLLWATACLLAISCGKNNDENQNQQGQNNGPPNGSTPTNNMSKGPGQLAISATADLQGAFGLLVMENSTSSASKLAALHNEIVDRLGLTGAPRLESGESFGLTAEDDAKLKKIDKSTGEIKDALKQEKSETTEQNQPMPQPLPNLLTIAVSPTLDVYLHFENSFVYKDIPQGVDGWDRRKGYQCQIFKVAGGTLTDLLTKAPSKNNLECLNNQHFIDNWRTSSNSVFQFDANGNVYYPGTNPETGKMAVYKRSRDGSTTTEMINANICIQNFLVTDAGGIFYTGQTCQDNNNGGGGQGGFFRYVAPSSSGSIVEIARNWWNFIYDTRVEDTTTTSGATTGTDTAVFFGPDPRKSTTASWDSACLFNFNPSESDPAARISDVITCGSDIWAWMEMNRQVDIDTYGYGYRNRVGSNQNQSPSTEWKTEYKRRCESKDEIFAGGGSQISAIAQDSKGEVYVIGNIRKKVEGSLSCDAEIKGPHCVVNNVPILTGSISGVSQSIDTVTKCSSLSGTWVDKGRCSNGASTSEACLQHDRTWNTTNNTCTSSTETNASDFNNRQNDCIPTWSPESVWYSGVSGTICSQAENGDLATWWDWSSKNNHYSKVESTSAQAASALAAKFIVRNFNCSQVSGTSSNNNWTNEFQSLAVVNKSAKTLSLLSSEREQAINLWIVEDKPYYSSFDSTLGKYLLNSIKSEGICVDSSLTTESACTDEDLTWKERLCVDTALTTKASCESASLVWKAAYPYTIKEDFETYNLAETGVDGSLFVDGLNFTNNQYQFGTLSLENKTITLKQGLTGTLKTIVILPK